MLKSSLGVCKILYPVVLIIMSESESSKQDTREVAIRAAQARSTPRDPDQALGKESLDEKKVRSWWQCVLLIRRMYEAHNFHKAFRRIIIAQIERHNDDRVSIESVKVLLKLASNILHNPGEQKYQQFRTTNPIIQRHLVEPKGALEYAVAMGFRLEVQNFQMIYIFKPTPDNMNSLRNGADCLNEVVLRHADAAERAQRANEAEKEAKAHRQELVRLAYEDDRKEKKVRDEMEKQRREAVAARAALEAVQDTPANAKEGSPDDRVPMTN